MRLSSFFVSILLISSSAMAALEEDQRKLENLLETQRLPESALEDGQVSTSSAPLGVNRSPAIVGAASEAPELIDSMSVSPAESVRPADDTR